MHEYGLFEVLFPEAELYPRDLLWQLTAESTDERVQEGKGLNPAFFYAALLWGVTEDRQAKLLADGVPPVPAWQQASQQVLTVQHQRTAIPRHVGQTVRDIWEMQPKLEQPRPRQIEATAQSERFRAGYDFLVLRELAGEDTGGMGAWWTRWQDADPGLRAEMARALEDKPAGVAKKKRRRKPSASA